MQPESVIFIIPSKKLSMGRTGAVVSVADYGPNGPRFETWPVRRSLWPWASHIYPCLVLAKPRKPWTYD